MSETDIILLPYQNPPWFFDLFTASEITGVTARRSNHSVTHAPIFMNSQPSTGLLLTSTEIVSILSATLNGAAKIFWTGVTRNAVRRGPMKLALGLPRFEICRNN